MAVTIFPRPTCFSLFFRPRFAPYGSMSRRTRRLLLLALPVLVALAAGAWLPWPRTAITRENVEKIQPGMTLEEAEAILGGPARDEAGGPVDREEGTFIKPDEPEVVTELLGFGQRPGRGVVRQLRPRLLSPRCARPPD
jgi:hypothetical protein